VNYYFWFCVSILIGPLVGWRLDLYPSELPSEGTRSFFFGTASWQPWGHRASVVDID